MNELRNDYGISTFEFSNGYLAADTAGSTLGVSMIGVADDGVVYGGCVTANAGSASTTSSRRTARA